jgi:hypothetical protein
MQQKLASANLNSGYSSRENLSKPSENAIKNILKPRPPSTKNAPSSGGGIIDSGKRMSAQNASESHISKKRTGSAKAPVQKKKYMSGGVNDPSVHKSSASRLIAQNLDDENFIWNGEKSFISTEHKFFYEQMQEKEN